MLLLNPRHVRFGSLTLEDVFAVAIDRSAHRAVEDWPDTGPYASFADVPEQKVRIRIEQELSAGDLGPPAPGDRATLTLSASPTMCDASRRRLTADAVVLSVTYDLSLKRGAARTITLAALSPDGAADPITLSDA